MTGLADASATYADPHLRADVSTDDWPFLYMPRRVYPIYYLAMVALVLMLSILLVGAFSDTRGRNIPAAKPPSHGDHRKPHRAGLPLDGRESAGNSEKALDFL